jgi:hypothetical protein
MPVVRCGGMACRARSRASAGSTFSFRVPASGRDRRDGLSKQGQAVWTDVQATAEALTTIAADPRDLGARIGVIIVLHTWGQNLQHHPHVHCLVPGGGISPDGKRWVACKRGFLRSVRVLARLFRRIFLDALTAAFDAGELQFFGDFSHLNKAKAFGRIIAPLHTRNYTAALLIRCGAGLTTSAHDRPVSGLDRASWSCWMCSGW